MKKYLVLLALICFSSQAKIKNILKDTSPGKDGKTYLAFVEDEKFGTGEWLLLFGNKGKRLSLRSFNISHDYFWMGNVGSDLTAKDSFYQLKFEVVKKDLEGELKLKGAKPGYDYQSIYRLHNDSTSARNFAKHAYSTFLRGLKKDLFGPLNSLTAFKTRLKTKALQFEAGIYDQGIYDTDTYFGFPVFGLQIEAYFSETPKNSVFKNALIRDNGTDALSKKFRESKTWMNNVDRYSFLEESLQAIMDADEWDDEAYENLVASSFISGAAPSLADKELQAAAKKFVRYEISNMRMFECEDGFYEWEDITWVLSDGSTFSYEAGLECD